MTSKPKHYLIYLEITQFSLRTNEKMIFDQIKDMDSSFEFYNSKIKKKLL
jgi:hypothetical protein